MFGWFKKKKTRTGYKIVPFLDKGFHIEEHTKGQKTLTYCESVSFGVYTIYGVFRHQYDERYYAITLKLFPSKQDARKLISSLIEKKTIEEAETKRKHLAIKNFSKENLPEWYP